MCKESITNNTLNSTETTSGAVVATLVVPEGFVGTLKERRSATQPNYYKTGNGTMNKHGIQSINLIDEIINSTKPSQWFINELIKRATYNHETGAVEFKIQLIGRTSTEKQYVQKAYKDLHNRNLVRRVKRSVYMLNPNAFITDYPKQLAVWNTLT